MTISLAPQFYYFIIIAFIVKTCHNLLSGLFFDATRLYNVGCRMIRKDLEESGPDLIEVYSGICLEVLKNITKTSGLSVSRPRFELSTS
jgi:hypothetical protein